jgi:mannosyltransferase
MPPRSSLVLLGLLVTIGGLLRVWQAGESLWIDELHTAWCAGGSLAEVAPRAAIGNQSPVFFWLEWLVLQTLGRSELMLRLPSLVAGTLLPAALFALAWRWTRSNLVALVAAALVVVEPLSIFYATEARPYAVVELLAVMHVAVFAELLARPTIGLRVAFVLGAALLFHLHYTSALLVVAEVGCWLLAAVSDGSSVRYKAWWLLLDLFYVAACAVPAAGNLLSIAGRRENWEQFVQQNSALEILTILPWSAVVMFALVDADTLLLRSSEETQCAEWESRVLLVMAWLLLPLAMAWVLTATDVARVFFPRYLVASAPAAILLAALIVRLPPWPPTRVSFGLMAVLFAVWSSGIVPQLRYDGRVIADRREDWRSAIAWLNDQPGIERELVLVHSGLIESDELRDDHTGLLEDYCLLPVTSLYRLQVRRSNLTPLPDSVPGILQPETQELARQRGAVWLISRLSQRKSRGLERQLLANLQSAAGARAVRPTWQITRSQSFGNVQVRRIEKTSGR